MFLSVSNISGSESHTFYIVGLCLLGFAGSVALFMPFFVFIQVGFQNESHMVTMGHCLADQGMKFQYDQQ